MPTEGRICTFLVSELWRTKGRCQFGDKTFAETTSCNYYWEVNLPRLIRKQRSRCWANSEIPEASRIPMPLLKCFHADHRYIVVFFGSPLQSLTTKPKATGRQKSTTNGLSLPIPSGHVVVLVGQSYLQKELSGRHCLSVKALFPCSSKGRTSIAGLCRREGGHQLWLCPARFSQHSYRFPQLNYCSRVSLQCWVSSCCESKWSSHTYTYIPSLSPQSVGQSSLGHTVGPC